MAGAMGIGGMGMGLTGSTPANVMNIKDGRKNSRMVQWESRVKYFSHNITVSLSIIYYIKKIVFIFEI